MRHFEVIIIGGGFAGSLAGAMLGRAGIATAVVDPHAVYPADFRCEKLDASQIAVLRRTGIAEPVLAAATPFDTLWVARLGRLVEKRPNQQFGIAYDALVNVVRTQIPPSVTFVRGTASALACSDDRQSVTVDGETMSARLVVLATGLNNRLRQSLGIERQEVLKAFSTPVGFDLTPVGRPRFAFPALTYYPEHPGDGFAYLTLFPIGQAMRANLFTYREPGDALLRRMREAPREAVDALMPGLRRLTGPYEIVEASVRPIDLYGVSGHERPGLVLVGDAFGTSCPAAGTGANKVLTDVERLCNVHIPRWLASPGMGQQKVAEFYADEVKRAADAHSKAFAHYVRDASTSLSLGWRARRGSRLVMQVCRGLARSAGDRLQGAAIGARTAAGRSTGAG